MHLAENKIQIKLWIVFTTSVLLIPAYFTAALDVVLEILMVVLVPCSRLPWERPNSASRLCKLICRMVTLSLLLGVVHFVHLREEGLHPTCLIPQYQSQYPTIFLSEHKTNLFHSELSVAYAKGSDSLQKSYVTACIGWKCILQRSSITQLI